MAGGRAPILECVRAGFGFLASDWRAIAPAAAIGALAITPAEVWADIAVGAGDAGGRLLAMVAGLLLQIPVLAAFYRRALGRGSAPLSLRLGADERNLLGVTAATGFVFMLAALGGLLIISMALAALAARSGIDTAALQRLPTEAAAKAFIEKLGPDGRVTLMSLGVVVFGFLLWLSARLALASPATIDAGRVRVFETWGWTKGNTGPVAAVLIIVLAFGVVLSTLAVAAPASLVAAVFGKDSLLAAGSPAHWIVTFLSAIAAYVFFHAPLAGAIAYLYRGLKPVETAPPAGPA